MEINKQLFEDVLSGKLKGTFVLKNGKRFNDKLLTDIYKFTVVLGGTTFYFNGKPIVSDYNGILDIVDFIPDTNMKENELTIEIPKGKIVDWDESKKQNKIVLKDKQLTYEEICEKLFSKLSTYYFVNNHGNIYSASSICNPYISNPNSATTTHQLECILAKNKLATVAKYLNNGWKPNKGDHVFTIMFYGDCKDKLIISEHYFGTGESLVLFRTQKNAKQTIEILGEETVKLALEPLGI